MNPIASKSNPHEIVVSKISTAQQFRKALNEIPGNATELSVVMNDASYPPDRRRACVRKYFAANLMPPFELHRLIQVLRSAKWFNPDNMELIQYVSGFIPLPPMENGTQIVIHVLPLQGGEYFLDIYVSLLGEIIIDRLRKVLGGAEMTAEENATMITEMVLWDSEDFKAFYGQKIKVVKEIEESGTRRNNKMSGEMKVLK